MGRLLRCHAVMIPGSPSSLDQGIRRRRRGPGRSNFDVLYGQVPSLPRGIRQLLEEPSEYATMFMMSGLFAAPRGAAIRPKPDGNSAVGYCLERFPSSLPLLRVDHPISRCAFVVRPQIELGNNGTQATMIVCSDTTPQRTPVTHLWKPAVSLFSGAGIGDVGYRAAGFDFLSMCEIEQERAALAKANFPTTKVFSADVQCIHDEVVPHVQSRLAEAGAELHLLTCTAPCQGMSKNGQGTLLRNVREGKRPSLDPRNRLILPALEIIH